MLALCNNQQKCKWEELIADCAGLDKNLCTYIQAQQLEDEVSHNGVALASPDLGLGEGINLPVRLHIHLLLLLLQLL